MLNAHAAQLHSILQMDFCAPADTNHTACTAGKYRPSAGMLLCSQQSQLRLRARILCCRQHASSPSQASAPGTMARVPCSFSSIWTYSSSRLSTQYVSPGSPLRPARPRSWPKERSLGCAAVLMTRRPPTARTCTHARQLKNLHAAQLCLLLSVHCSCSRLKPAVLYAPGSYILACQQSWAAYVHKGCG